MEMCRTILSEMNLSSYHSGLNSFPITAPPGERSACRVTALTSSDISLFFFVCSRNAFAAL